MPFQIAWGQGECDITNREPINPRGLSQAEAASRLHKFGPNALPEPKGPSLTIRFLRQFASPIIYLLLVALGFDFGIWIWEGRHGFPFESAAIAVILLLNSVLGVYQEYRADSAIGKLRELAAPSTWVFRDGVLAHLPVRDLVPGDMVRLEAGDRVAADGFLIESTNALVDESVLTGESLPLEKMAESEVFSGTQMVRGQALYEVSRTGVESSLGRLAVSLQSIEMGKTPLERKLDAFGKRTAKWILALALIILLFGVALEGLGAFSRVLLFAVALAVAAVPEGMPAVLTLTLARGIERMARQKAVVRRVSSVETLGSVTVIASDKTGTLTENELFVREVKTDAHDQVLKAMVLANDADLEGGAGDPLELALYDYARGHGIDPRELRDAHLRLDSIPFDSSHKYMSVTSDLDGEPSRLLKGAPEVVLELCAMDADERRRWHTAIDEAAKTGHRVIGFAAGPGATEQPLSFLGIALLWDQPRPEVAEALAKADKAGVRVVMVTGDHPATSLSLAKSIGLRSDGVIVGKELMELSAIPKNANIFARMLPEHKQRLVELFRSQGEIVAMTGDGVNDAPALKRADVGIAMGRRGSDVAREVADIVLLDDNFATIIAAMEQGRAIYANIQKFIRFLLSTNLAEVVIVVGGVFGSVLFNLRDQAGALLLPLTALQLLYINLVTDGPVALALGMDENPDAMSRRPLDPSTPLLDRESGRFVIVTGLANGMLALMLLVALPALSPSPEVVRTGLFHYMVLTQLALAYPSRGVGRSKPNVVLACAIAFSVALQCAMASIPSLRAVLGLEPVTLQLGISVGVSVVITWAAAELFARSPRRAV